MELTKFLLEPTHEQRLTVHNLCIFGSRDREREGFNMTDLEALVSSRGEGNCAIYGLYRYVPL